MRYWLELSDGNRTLGMKIMLCTKAKMGANPDIQIADVRGDMVLI